MIRFIIKMSRGFRSRIAVITVSGVMRVALGLVFVFLSKQAVDIATGVAGGNIIACVLGLAGALVLQLTCSAVANRTTDLAEADMRNEIEKRYFSHALEAEWNGRETFHSGDILSRVTEDSRVIAECLCRTLPTVIMAVTQFIGAFIFLCYFSPLLAVILAVILPFFIISGKIFFRKTQILTRKIRETESRLQESMQESLQHRILLLTYNSIARTMEGISSLLNERITFIRRRTNLTVFSRTAVIAGFHSGYLAAFLWGIAGLSKGTISFGIMTAYLQLAGQIQQPLAELARLLPGLIQSHTAFTRLAEIRRLPSFRQSPEERPADNHNPVGIEFRDVSFAYPGSGKKIFENFSHTFLPGSKTAITGETGVGKSTLFRMILGLLTPQEGDIRLFRNEDGERKDIPATVAARNHIVYIPQGNSLLSGTIRRNLLIGNPDATDDEMKEALHSAAADFVFDLKSGLDTPCGEHGDGLSEGQAQRIAIARGLLRPGAILLLDEISSSLDESTETLLLQRLAERQTGHTVLMVTHRKSVLAYSGSTLHLPPASTPQSTF